MRMYDVKVNEIPKYLTNNLTYQTHSIKPYLSHCTYMGSLRILPSGIQIWRSTIVARTSVPQRWSHNGIQIILLFSIRKIRS